ncbi:ATP-dependent Clp protease ATP-binding subunit [Limibaculum sp. M0105]|uniref:ATP-dependent Clp protease ATP-binding subunit n=1 Tax=Thermohalobaculum xanthum TaxID=2753746 RepID=A0A8J7M4I8_9RHOB|nr:AAA family ATPase [Thermohalobaculum xanthum]MBK0398144.1 ATP-dependent Clp protease ATP-binding subunit [Thermohalobaculum xanthum]
MRREETGIAPAQGGKPFPAPLWLRRIELDLAVRSQFAVSGNIRDLFAVDGPRGPQFLPAADALWSMLEPRGFAGLLVHDPLVGMQLHPGASCAVAGALGTAGVELGGPGRDLGRLAHDLLRIAELATPPVAVLLDYASHLCAGEPQAGTAREDFFIALDKMSHALGAPREQRADGRPPARNPIIWLLKGPHDLPDWFVIGNEAISRVTADLPDIEERYLMAATRAAQFRDYRSLSSADVSKALEQYALETEGMTLRAVHAISELARAEGIGLAQVSDAVRAYRVGTPRNPWSSGIVRRRIGEGAEILGRRVKGQPNALRKTIDILTRSVMGLSGAQTSSRHNRPRGVLFFAGPTGVGKTELAKSVTELLFGDETAYHRFDMSEFSSENSESRLIGAPPGYAGYQAGGELVNAARSRPFSVFLFDEIEKAHPRILDKFLQIVDEGRLTDQRGETVTFSESLIIFTSNMGIVGDDRTNNMAMNVLPSDSYEEMEHKIVTAIRDHFRIHLKRPELINRIGQNIIIFEFIRASTALMIFESIMKRVLIAVREEHGVAIDFTEKALSEIEELCTYDLFDGGRGIGNRVETVFVNPLAHALFDRPDARSLKITGLDHSGPEIRLVCA